MGGGGGDMGMRERSLIIMLLAGFQILHLDVELIKGSAI